MRQPVLPWVEQQRDRLVKRNITMKGYVYIVQNRKKKKGQSLLCPSSRSAVPSPMHSLAENLSMTAHCYLQCLVFQIDMFGE